MIRGILSGGVWGLITAAAGLSVASLLAPQPAGNAPPLVPQVDAPDVAGSPPEPGGGAVAEGPVAADTALEPARPNVGPLAPVEPSSVTDLADTAPAPLPEAGAQSAAIVAPVVGAAPEVAAIALVPAPVIPAGPATAPQIPAQDRAAIAATDPATPRPGPEPVDAAAIGGDIAAPEVPVATETIPDLTLATPPSATPPSATDSAPLPEPASGAQPAPDALPAIDDTGDQAPAAADAAGVLEPVADAVPAPDVSAAELTPSDAAAAVPPPLAEPTPATDAPAAPPDAAAPAAGADAPGRIALAGAEAALPPPVANVRINRPTTGADTPAETAPEAAILPDLAEQPALARYAAAFDNPAGLPAMSVILIDTGALDGGPTLLAGLPFPVTVAIDAGQQGAGDLMQAYRAAGFEVVALARLPIGAQPTDVEVTLEAAFATLPEAIGLLDAGEGGLQANSAITSQAMGRLAQDGRGVVTVAQGLNMAARAAAEAGVPAGTIYRDLDSDGQDAATIRRFLDQAAFRARQDGGVILLARLRPDSLSALILWGGANRAGQVALAPVSVLLGAADATR